MTFVRNEYPRPRMVRANWLSLNGEWGFDFDDEDRGLVQRWFENSHQLGQDIIVPFAYQSKASGIDVQDYHPIVWYSKAFTVPEEWLGQRLILHFGAVDYEATVWVNGVLAANHQGGYTPFSCDITTLLAEGQNRVVVRAADEARVDLPRGKQSARKNPWACWYTPVTGIWQSVWIEPVQATYFTDVHLVPDIDDQSLTVNYTVSQIEDGLTIEAIATAEEVEICRTQTPLPKSFNRWGDILPVTDGTFQISVSSPRLWSPESPFLYDLVLRLKRGEEIVDEVQTYFGMRKVHVEHGQFFLNNRAYYQRLVLDQGYWPEGIYTASSLEDIRKDVELTKAMGFNGARKHQKIEEPHYYYFCDKLGLLVWSEMPSAYHFTSQAVSHLTQEWQEAILRDRSHPSIVTWVPQNESWGIGQMHSNPSIIAYMVGLYYMTHALDGTRPVVSNDGWELAESDLITIHEYTQDHEVLTRHYEAFLQNPHQAVFSHGKPILLPDYPNEGMPILITEFGGIKVEAQKAQGWGYGQAAADYDEMLERFKALVRSIKNQPSVVGYCYTQLTDVQQEVNGLLTFDRRPKVDPALIRAALLDS